MSLTLAEAERVVQAALGKARELGIDVSVAACDAGGRLVAFARMDEANWAGVYDSQGKAVAAAAFRADSSSLQGWADSPLMRAIVASDGGHMMPSRGGVLVRRGGQVVGACGVGGGTSEEDEECALAGAAALG